MEPILICADQEASFDRYLGELIRLVRQRPQ
jgi:hypothetical protein